jgi:hypothetical protein
MMLGNCTPERKGVIKMRPFVWEKWNGCSTEKKGLRPGLLEKKSKPHGS